MAPIIIWSPCLSFSLSGGRATRLLLISYSKFSVLASIAPAHSVHFMDRVAVGRSCTSRCVMLSTLHPQQGCLLGRWVSDDSPPLYGVWLKLKISTSLYVWKVTHTQDLTECTGMVHPVRTTFIEFLLLYNVSLVYLHRYWVLEPRSPLCIIFHGSRTSAEVPLQACPTGPPQCRSPLGN